MIILAQFFGIAIDNSGLECVKTRLRQPFAHVFESVFPIQWALITNFKLLEIVE